MHFRIPLIAVLMGYAAAGFAQAPLTFDAASVKAAVPAGPGGRGVFAGAPRGGPGSNDPAQITWPGASLLNMLVAAYDVKLYQVTGPEWLRTEHFDIVVKVPADATRQQVAVMWQNLLKERFGVALHKESKEFPADDLVVARGGAKLQETSLDPATQQPPPAAAGRGPGPGAVMLGPGGAPVLTRAGLVSTVQNGPSGLVAHLAGKAQTTQSLAAFLANELGHPVTDKTGLTGKYDFQVEYAADAGARSVPGAAADAASDPGSDIGAALQQQLGLRLVKGKAPLEMIVVDHAEKAPTGN